MKGGKRLREVTMDCAKVKRVCVFRKLCGGEDIDCSEVSDETAGMMGGRTKAMWPV